MKNKILKEAPHVGPIRCIYCNLNFYVDPRMELWPFDVKVKEDYLRKYYKFKKIAIDCPNCHKSIVYDTNSNKTFKFDRIINNVGPDLAKFFKDTEIYSKPHITMDQIAIESKEPDHLTFQKFSDVLNEAPVIIPSLNINNFDFPEIEDSIFNGSILIKNILLDSYLFKTNNTISYRFLNSNNVVVAINILILNDRNMITLIWQHKKYQGIAKEIFFNVLLPKYNILYVDVATTHEGKNAIINIYKNISKYNCECWIWDLNTNKNYKIINIVDLYNTWKGTNNEKKIIYFKQL